MKRIALGGVAAALVAAVPASIGLIGNAGFSEAVPVRPPASATLLDDHGNPLPKTPASTDDGRHHVRHSRHAEPGDDHGGDHGDDHGRHSRHAEPGDQHRDDHGGGHGSGGDDRGHRGGDDGRDHGRHGSDD